MLFAKVLIHESLWLNLELGGERLRRRLHTLVRQVEAFYAGGQLLKGERIRPLDGAFKIRVTDALRIPFYFREVAGGTELVFGAVVSHEEGVRLHEGFAAELADDELLPLFDSVIEADGDSGRAATHTRLYRVWDEAAQARIERDLDADLPLWFDPAQAALAAAEGPLLVRGGAGTGKTAVAVHRLLLTRDRFLAVHGREPRQLYLTANDRLRREAETWHRRLAEPPAHSPAFMTVEQLCRVVLGASASQYPEERRMTLRRFKQRGYHRFSHSDAYGTDDALWEEVMGLVKAGPATERLLRETTGAYSIAQRKDAEEQNARGATAEARTAHRALVEAARQHGLWDEVDLAREALAALLREPGRLAPFDEVVVDEAQDLNLLQLALAIRACASFSHLFFTGDHLQAILPSRFGWKEGRMLFFELTGKPQAVMELRHNFRSPGNHVRWAANLLAWRERVMGEDGTHLEPQRPDRPLIWVEPYQVPRSTTWLAGLMVLVFDQEGREEAVRRFGEGCVFTVFEAKGLERPHVLLWRPYGRRKSVWQRLADLRAGQGLPGAERRVLVQWLNIWNVSLTRSTDTLGVCDDDSPAWDLLNPAFTGGSAREHWLSTLVQASTIEETRDEAHALEEDGRWAQAAAQYQAAGHHGDAARCFSRIERWADAAAAYTAAGEVDIAKGLWEKAAQEAEERGDLVSALAAVERTTQAGEAERLKHSLEERRAAAARLVGQRRLAEAAALLERIGDPASAALLHEQGEDWTAAAACHLAYGSVEKAASCYLKAREWARARELFEAEEDWAAAAECSLKLQDLRGAARRYLQAGDRRRAREVFERLGDWTAAADASEALGELTRAAECHQKAKNWLRAARLFRDCGDGFKEAEALSSLAHQLTLGLGPETGDAWKTWEVIAHLYDLAAQARGKPSKAAGRAWDEVGQAVARARAWDVLGRFAQTEIVITSIPEGLWREAADALRASGKTQLADACLRRFDQLQSLRARLAESPDGARLNTAGGLGAPAGPHVSRRPAIILTGHNAAVCDLAFSPDGAQLVSVCRGGRTVVWRLGDGAELQVVVNPGEESLVTRFHEDGKSIGIFLSTGRLKLVEVGPEDAVRRVRIREKREGRAAAFDPLLSRVAVPVSGHGIAIFDLASKEKLVELTGNTSPVRHLCFSDDGRRLACATGDAVAIWDVNAGAEVRRLRMLAGKLVRVRFGPGEGHVVASGSQTSVCKVGQAVTPIALEGVLCAPHPNGNVVATVVGLHLICLTELSTRESLRMFDFGRGSRVTALTFSPDGCSIVAADERGTIKVWRL